MSKRKVEEEPTMCTEEELKERILEVFLPLLKDELELTTQMGCKRQCHTEGIEACESHQYPLELVEDKMAVFQRMRNHQYPLYESIYFAKGHVPVNIKK